MALLQALIILAEPRHHPGAKVFDKNVSGGQYAFNWLQQRLLPEGYRAPAGTYRKFGGTPT